VRRRPPGWTGDGDPVPEELTHFDIDEWGGVVDVLGAYGRWKAARRAWVAEGNGWPGGPEQMEAEESEIRLPDEPWDPSRI